MVAAGRLRILAYNATAHLGGAEKSLREAVLAADHHWYLAAPEGELLQSCSAEGRIAVPGLRLNSSVVSRVRALFKLPCITFMLWRYRRRVGAQLLYANGFSSFLGLLPLALLTATPLILHLRDTPRESRLYRWLCSFAAATIVPAHWMQFPGAEVIENGVDISALSNPERQGGEVRKIIMVSQFVPWKRCENFIEMAGLLSADYPDLQFELIGGDPLDENSSYVKRLHAAAADINQLIIRPWQRDVGALYRDADLLVIPSRDEPFGRVAVEAAAAGVALLTVPGSGPAEIIDQGRCGFLAADASTEALARSARWLMAHPAAVAEKQKLLHQRIDERYRAECSAAKVAALCERVVAHRRVAINGALLTANPSGVEHSIAELLKALPAQRTVLPAPALRANRLLRIVWEHLLLPFRLRSSKLLHAPGYIRPLCVGRPTLLTVHDAIAITHPHYCTFLNRLYYRLLLGRSIDRAQLVAVPSQFVADELERLFAVDPLKLRVIPWAPRAVFNEVIDAERRERPYLLHVGNAEPKKNISLLLDLLPQLPEYELLLVGAEGWCYDLPAEIERRGLAERVTRLGYVDDPRLAALYAGAHAFLFPSLIEGFGLPILEAMAAGAPVIASNCGSLPEVADGAAQLLDPHDSAAWVAAVRNLESEELRRSVIERGRTRANQFSWQQTAADYSQLYREIIDGV